MFIPSLMKTILQVALDLLNEHRALTIAKDSVNGKRLWKTNGSTEGTIPLGNVFPDFKGSENKRAISFKGNLLFTGSNSQSGSELWNSDGSEGGTLLLKDIYPGETHSSPDWLTEYKDYVYC